MGSFFDEQWIKHLCDQINMPKEALFDIVETVKSLNDKEEQFLQDFYEKLICPETERAAAGDMQNLVEKDPSYGQKIVSVYLSAAKHTYKRYQEKGISDTVFYDTMKSFTVYENSYLLEHGVYGFDKPSWAANHLRMSLYRLGRLVFEQSTFPQDFSDDKTILHKGDHILMVHIPANEKLDMERCQKAYDMAEEFSERYFGFQSHAFCCCSWLLHSGLKNLLPAESNIIKFQNEFTLIGEKTDREEVLKWLFGKKHEQLEEYPAITSLQKNVISYLKTGGELGTGFGIRKQH
jgi:hypothetical protein